MTNIDQPRQLLTVVLYQRGDVQAGYSDEGYKAVLDRALALVGKTPVPVNEEAARKALERARRAAVAAGLHSLPFLFRPARAAADVLRKFAGGSGR